jgi:hypothetical protein
MTGGAHSAQPGTLMPRNKDVHAVSTVGLSVQSVHVARQGSSINLGICENADAPDHDED